MYVNTARYVRGKEPVAKHHIPITSAHASNEHRMWQRRNVGGNSHSVFRWTALHQPTREMYRKKKGVGGESREARDN